MLCAFYLITTPGGDMKNLKLITGFVGIFLITVLYANNCSEVDFGSNKPSTTLEVADTGNNGQSVPTGDGDNTPDEPLPEDPLTPPKGHHDGDYCRGGKEHDHHRGDGCKHDEDGDENHHDEDRDENKRRCHASCGNNGIKDIVVNIDYIEIRGTHGKVLTLTGDLGEVSIIGGSLPIAVSEDIDIVSIRLVLKKDNNYIIDNDDKRVNLKTPSGQQSGIKIPFQGVSAAQGGAYSLKFKINPETQVVKAGKKCILKPVLHFVSFTSL